MATQRRASSSPIPSASAATVCISTAASNSPPFELIEFTLDFPSRSGSVDQYCCTGVVAQCQYDCDCKLFQAIVTFLDVPDQARKRIDKLTAAPSSSPPCPSSENC